VPAIGSHYYKALAPLLEQLLAGLELPGREAVYRLADKRSRGAIAQFSQIVCELAEL